MKRINIGLSGLAIVVLVGAAVSWKVYEVAYPLPVSSDTVSMSMLRAAMTSIARADTPIKPFELTCESQEDLSVSVCKGTGNTGPFSATFRSSTPSPMKFKLAGQIRADGLLAVTAFVGVPERIPASSVDTLVQVFSTRPQVAVN